MKNITQVFLSSLLLLCTLSASAQEIDYLKKANESFIKGNYSYAVTMYKMYFAETGRDVSALQQQAEQCRDYLKAGDDAAIIKDYATAKRNYQLVLNLNPEDSAVRLKLSSLQNSPSVPDNLQVGDEYLGGIVAYIDPTGKHGFIIHSISKNPIIDADNKYYNAKKARETCPEGLRLPSTAELKLMSENINKLPLHIDTPYFVNDETYCPYIIRYVKKKSQFKKKLEYGEDVRLQSVSISYSNGFAIYVKDF